MNEIQIENALQNAAPVLPEALKAQTLRQCRLTVEQRDRKYRRTQRILCGAIVAVCAFQWLIVGQLDAQSARWVNNGDAPAQTRVASDDETAPVTLAAFAWRGDWRERKFALSSFVSEPNEMAR